MTKDLAGSMKRIDKRCFPDAVRMIDRFHVQKLVPGISVFKNFYIFYIFSFCKFFDGFIFSFNGFLTMPDPDILKGLYVQLLARSRYLLYKSRRKWSKSQSKRSDILFREYPDLEKAYQLTDGLRKIYNQHISKPAV